LASPKESVRAPQLLVMKWNGGKDGDAPVALLSAERRDL
jgi:hypothetical protein